VWSDRASPFSFAGPKRHNAPGIAFEALPPIDTVLVSHGHYDHLDLATLSRLRPNFHRAWSRRSATNVTMRSADARDPRRSIRLAQPDRTRRRSRVTLVPTRHWTARAVRSQQIAVGELRAGDSAGKIYIVCDFRLWRRQTFPQGRGSAWPVAPSDPADRRL